MEHSRLAMLVPDGIIRSGIESVIKQSGFSQFEITAFDDPEAFLRKAASFSILLVDISGMGFNQIEQMFVSIATCCPSQKVIVISNRLTAKHVRRVMQLGAKGFIYRDDLFGTLLNSLELVSRDVVTMSSQVLEMLTDNHQLYITNDLKLLDISVLRLMARGYTVKKIALELHVSARSVYRSRDKMRQVLNVPTNEMLIEAARKYGLLDFDDE